jgi:transcriptional regulator with AAA-type ATPase domain
MRGPRRRGERSEAALDQQVSPVTAAKAYRLMKTIMTTAVDDGAIRRNPCRIKVPPLRPRQSGPF